jgi:hypothetical protein
MTVDQLQRRDRRIAALEARGDARTIAEEDELQSLLNARHMHLRRLPTALRRTREKAAQLEAYARQIGFNLNEGKHA